MDEIQIFVPQGFFGASEDDTSLDSLMRRLSVIAYGQTHTEDASRKAWDCPERYGTEFENETFLLCPAYQDSECDCGFSAKADQWHEQNPHLKTCYYEILNGLVDTWESQHPSATYDQRSRHETRLRRKLCARFSIEWNDGFGSAVRCTCGKEERAKVWFADNEHDFRCPHRIPNFWFKPSDFQLWWYKYIGRDMKPNRPMDADELKRIADACLCSLADGKPQ